MLTVLLSILACSGSDAEPAAIDAIFHPDDFLELGTASYPQELTASLPLATLSIENKMDYYLTVEPKSLTGGPADKDIVQLAETTALIVLEPRGVADITVGVAPGLTYNWTDGIYDGDTELAGHFAAAVLRIDLSADLPKGGALIAAEDTATGGTELVRETRELSVHVALECDIDGDGVEASECEASTSDCNDRDVAVPGVEVCGNGVDEDCNGADETCAE